MRILRLTLTNRWNICVSSVFWIPLCKYWTFWVCFSRLWPVFWLSRESFSSLLTGLCWHSLLNALCCTFILFSGSTLLCLFCPGKCWILWWLQHLSSWDVILIILMKWARYVLHSWFLLAVHFSPSILEHIRLLNVYILGLTSVKEIAFIFLECNCLVIHRIFYLWKKFSLFWFTSLVKLIVWGVSKWEVNIFTIQVYIQSFYFLLLKGRWRFNSN